METSSLRDGFGSVVNFVRDTAREVGEFDLRRLEIQNASRAAIGNSQSPPAVTHTGVPVNNNNHRAGGGMSALVYIGAGLLLSGGAFALYNAGKK